MSSTGEGERRRPAHDPQSRPLAVLLTPPAQGGISVITLAGPGSATVLSALFVSPHGARPGSAPPGKLLYGRLAQGSEALDEVIVCRVPVERGLAPVFEINCHGGALPALRVLQALIDQGATEATWRDFLDAQVRAGAMDAVQAEAAEALPRALNLPAARMLLAQRRGALSNCACRAADLASADPAAARRVLEQASTAARYGRRLAQPGRVGVAGRPNVGKSSLLNALLRHDRVIVHERPGTTRDVIEEKCDVAGLPVWLVDMAGLRRTRDHVEAEGVRRARQAMRGVDVLLLVLDGSAPLRPEDRDLLGATRDRPRLLVVNKSDLPARLDAAALIKEVGAPDPCHAISALTGDGLDKLEADVVRVLAGPCPDLEGAVPFTERQERLLGHASRALAADPPDVAAARKALASLAGGTDARV